MQQSAWFKYCLC